MAINTPYQGAGENYIKGNLPASAEAYEHGSGEGVFFIVDDETRAAYDANEPKTDRLYYGILDNDSIYYLGLTHGERLPLEMRGEFRPVVPLDYLREHWELNPLEFNQGETGDGEDF